MKSLERTILDGSIVLEEEFYVNKTHLDFTISLLDRVIIGWVPTIWLDTETEEEVEGAYDVST